MNAIMYILKTGCQWRMLPKDFPPHNTVFYYFNKWKLEGVFEELMDTLHRMVRKLMGREETPSLGIIDSRSVKSSHHVDADRGIDGNKKIKGRKEHIVVDTLGLPMSVVVHEANVHDSVGADGVIDKMKGCFPRLKKMLADGGYKGQKIVRYRTPKARCGAYRCSPSGRVFEEILRAAAPMDCGALFLLAGKLSKNRHGLRVLF